jgi:hypothetical protein
MYIVMYLKALVNLVMEVKMPKGKDKREVVKQLTIEAQLLDTGIEAPKPGVMYVISIMRYKVLKVVHGVYPYQIVFVGHHVPDLNSPQFRIGVRHRLKLRKSFPENASILNKFQDEKDNGSIFFCVSFEVLE